MRLDSYFQLYRILQLSVEWNGTATVVYVSPLRILVYMGDMKVEALVDTESDFDAIDSDLSQQQMAAGNNSFHSRSGIATQSVSGFSTSMSNSITHKASWELRLVGHELPADAGKSSSKEVMRVFDLHEV